MAEMIFCHKMVKRGLNEKIEVDSAALSREEVGETMHPRARRMLLRNGVPCTEHVARQITAEDGEKADLILCMEMRQIAQLQACCPAVAREKIHLLLDYADRKGDIADPWYTDDFEKAYRDIDRGCEGLVKAIAQE